jgi:ankyrin repeat protein
MMRAAAIGLLAAGGWLHAVAEEAATAPAEAALPPAAASTAESLAEAGTLYASSWQPHRAAQVLLYPTLREAVQACDLYGAIEHLQGVPLDWKDKESALLLAAEQGCPEIAAEMLRESVSVNTLDAAGRSALHLAAAANRVYTIDMLLRHRGEHQRQRHEGYFPLHVAAEAGGYESIHAMLHYGANLSSYAANNEPAVLTATKAGHTHTVELFDQIGLPATIFELVIYGDIESVKRRLNALPSLVMESDGIRETALTKAVRTQQLEIARVLLDFGALPNHCGVDEIPMLVEAALTGNMDMIALLLERGAEINGRDPTHLQEQVLHAIVRKGNIEMIPKLLALGADVNGRNTLGETPLHIAVSEGLSPKIEALIAAGADPGARMNDGRTPLHLAVQAGNQGLSELLLSRGASASTRDLKRETPLHLAAAAGNTALARLLLAHGARVEFENQRGRTPLALAARGGHEAMVALLLENESPLNERDLHGWTALHHATSQGREPVVRQLLEAGADVNVLDEEGHGPLWIALDVLSMPLAREYAGRGADMQLLDVRGRSLLYAPLHSENTAFALWLLDAGLSADVRDVDGLAPLHEAARYGTPDTARLLIDRGAPLEALDAHGQTPMHLAAGRGHILMVKTLGDMGARFDVRDKAGKMALHVAAENGHWGPIQYFILRGQPIDITTSSGDTALHISAREGFMRTASLLAGKSSSLLAKNGAGMTPLQAAEAARPIWSFSVNRTPDLADRELAMQVTHNYLRLAMCEYVVELIDAGNAATMRLLLETHPEFVNFVFQGWTPLHRAVQKGDAGIAAVLLEFGADPNRLDERGEMVTPLDLAGRSESSELIELLREASAVQTASAEVK